MKEEAVSSDLYNTIWSFFCSVKLTVFVLIALAATSIIGTLIPQNQDPMAYLRTYGEVFYRIFHVLDIFDMYHAWWFQFLLLLLTINVIVCSVDRLSATWKIVFVHTPSFKASRFRRLSHKTEFSANHPIETIEATLGPVVSRMFTYSTMEKDGEGFRIFSEKGRWTRLGVYAVHLSVILLLIGGMIGSIFGFEGYVNIPEGDTIRSVRLQGSNAMLPLGFDVRCDDFNVSFYDSGMPKEYRSRLTVLEKGRPALQKDIIVNDPLRYKGINFFQSSYGNLPPREVTLNFENTETGATYKKTLKIGQQIKISENMGKFIIKDYTPRYNFRNQDIGEAFLGVLVRENQDPVDIILPVRFPNFDKMRKGNPVVSVLSYTPRYYTGLQVTRDPGVWVVYAGFVLLILGCMITFFMSHQRLCVEVIRKGNRSLVTISGFANKNKLGMQQKVTKISRKLQALISASPQDFQNEEPS